MRKSALFWMRVFTCLPCAPDAEHASSFKVMHVPSHTRSFCVPATSWPPVTRDADLSGAARLRHVRRRDAETDSPRGGAAEEGGRGQP